MHHEKRQSGRSRKRPSRRASSASLGVLSANALVAADYVVIPMQAEYLSLQGMAKLLEVIDLVQKQLNPNLQIACVLPCMLDSRRRPTLRQRA